MSEILAELTTPTLRPDRPVMYEWEGRSYVSVDAECLGNNVTNVRALFTEDEVMGASTEIFKRVWQGEIPWDVARNKMQAQLDAIKYGSSYE